MTNFKIQVIALGILIFLACGARTSAQSSSIIYVTSLDDTIGAGKGRTLKEAIYSASLRASLAIGNDVVRDGYPVYLPTQCVPGRGDDIIVLPTSDAPVVFQLSSIIVDVANPVSLAGLPPITSKITIEGNGATITWNNATCQTSYAIWTNPSTSEVCNARLFVVTDSGNLTILDTHVKGFAVQGGSGVVAGSGGGLEAGGAIYVRDGQLTVVRSTFDGNSGTGGNGGGLAAGFGSPNGGGGGGGLGRAGGARWTSTPLSMALAVEAVAVRRPTASPPGRTVAPAAGS
jgi:hypothetical protein